MRILAPPDPNAIAYPDFICADTPGNARLLSQVIEELRSRKDIGWDILTLPKVFSSSPVMTSAPVLARADLFSHQRGICYYFKCDRGMPAITAQISSGLRKHMRRCRRQLSDLGSLEFVSSRDPAALPALFDEFLALEASGWKGVTGEATAIRLDPGLVQFYSGLLARFVETGECEVNLLRLNGRNIAGQFCLISGGTWYHLKIAYDEEFDTFSPGFVLLEEVLSRLCEDDQVHTANYLTGAEWADRWHPDKLDVIRLVVRNDTFMGHVAMQEIIMRRLIRERILPRAAQIMRKVKAVRGKKTTL
jgi:CelD/BcsL family acetyltransferase involved in cellulose biosynthesis